MYKRYIIIGLVFVLIVNLLAWICPAMCDWYTLNVTPVMVNVFGRFSDIFPFSVGEIMIVLGIVLVLISIVIGVLFIFFRKKTGYAKFTKKFYKVFFSILVGVCIVMTLNCSILYHCTPIDPNPKVDYRTYTAEELEILRNYIVEKCNYYAELMDRDEKGYIIYDGDLQKEAVNALHNISDQFPKLKGYYPDVKTLLFSDLLSQAYTGGYYFPFSVEANVNGNMYIANYPDAYCHELSHLHGYIYEDEANFIAYMACVNSEDAFFKYSGYLGVLIYVDNAYYDAINQDMDRYNSQVIVDSMVWDDTIFLTEETWEEVEEDAFIDTETVEEISDEFTEATLNLNGVEEGMVSYSKVVDLLLQYYDGKLY
ncbi:MAG: DUF3810 domain-containing protein [Lachnospiraceae bacterium]|nr:DUF3810 domain-containing protein [Lachnospiraceae bacterium]